MDTVCLINDILIAHALKVFNKRNSFIVRISNKLSQKSCFKLKMSRVLAKNFKILYKKTTLLRGRIIGLAM